MSARFAPVRRSHYDLIVVLFVSFLLLSNIAATKLIEIDVLEWSLVFDGGAILFPLTYILGDVISEVYGFKPARRAILLGMAVSILASAVFYLVQIAPPAADYENQAAFEAVLGFVPRIVAASVIAYAVGQLINAWVLVTIKERYGEGNLWVRLLGSTVAGTAADTAIFCTVAWAGVMPAGTILNLMIVGYVYKVAVEFVLLPLTYRVVALVKQNEPAYQEIA